MDVVEIAFIWFMKMKLIYMAKSNMSIENPIMKPVTELGGETTQL